MLVTVLAEQCEITLYVVCMVSMFCYYRFTCFLEEWHVFLVVVTFSSSHVNSGGATACGASQREGCVMEGASQPPHAQKGAPMCPPSMPYSVKWWQKPVSYLYFSRAANKHTQNPQTKNPTDKHLNSQTASHQLKYTALYLVWFLVCRSVLLTENPAVL